MPTWYRLLLVATPAVVLSIVLAIRTRPPRVELLPFSDSPPAWNGSEPYLVVSLADREPDPGRFKASIQKIVPTVRHDLPINEFRVDLHSGMFVLRQTDLFVSDTMPLSLTRTYRVWDSYSRAFGAGANHPYDICPTGTRRPYTYMDLNLEDDRRIHFRRISKGTDFADAVFRHETTSSEFFGAQIAWNGNGWTLSFRDGSRFKFPEAYYAKNYAQGAPIEMQDAGGHSIQFKRDGKRNLKQLISPSKHAISFKYDETDRIVEAVDDSGNIRRYSYDSSGHLRSVTDASHLLYRFEYTLLLHLANYDPYLMTSVVDGSGVALLKNIYDNAGRVSEQSLADGQVFRHHYVVDERFEIIETTVSGPVGERRFSFQSGMVVKDE